MKAVGSIVALMLVTGCMPQGHVVKPQEQTSSAVRVSVAAPEESKAPVATRTRTEVTSSQRRKAVSSKPKAAVEEDKGWWESVRDFFSIEPVRPWQKATLARDTMKPAGPIPGAEKFILKIYTSKEGSRGGTGVAGGGCGCN